MAKYVLGVDFGTLSVRTLLVNVNTGEEVTSSVYQYPHGVMDTQLPTGESLPQNWALQHPQDYIDGLCYTIEQITSGSQLAKEDIVGIGVDFTGSTLLPVREDGYPLCLLDQFKREPHAYVKLWKHHGCEKEANDIEQIAKDRQESWLSYYGNNVSSEWTLPKILETLRQAPHVYEEAGRFVDAVDWIIWLLTGVQTRSACASGYKAFYRHTSGYPSKDFLKALDPRLENLFEEKMAAPVAPVGQRAGFLTKQWAEKLGLCETTAVGVGILDAHASFLGCGVNKPNEMSIVIGTSSCHMCLCDQEIATEGICGTVKDGILPGYFGYEAGQSCVGDQYAWFMNHCVPESYAAEARTKNISIHALMQSKLIGYKAGQSGLLALDWFNGVRSPLMDFDWSGLILGLHLKTKREEIYLALIESTAYGTRRIIESFESKGIPIHSVVLCGGIPLKNPTLVQIYADVINRDITVSESSQTSALGAAVLAIAAAGQEVTGYADIYEAVGKIGRRGSTVWHPQPQQVAIYNKLYEEYKTLCEYFGHGANDVMKRLSILRNSN